MSNIDKRALREAAEKATALNLDTAQEARLSDDECIECPTCGGDGYMEVQRDYCNIDGVALGVLFYGIGEHHGMAEAFFRAANPSTVLVLLDELEAKDRRIAEQACVIAKQEKWIKDVEATMITATDRAEAAGKRIAELERKPTWINHCDKTVPAALRYLAENPRPIGGSSSYNTEHLYNLAREIEIVAGTAKGE